MMACPLRVAGARDKGGRHLSGLCVDFRIRDAVNRQRREVVVMCGRRRAVAGAALLISALWVVGCSEEQPPTQSDRAPLENPFAWVGDLHSEAMEFGRARLAKSEQARVEAVEVVTREFLANKDAELRKHGAGRCEIDYGSVISIADSDTFLAYLGKCRSEGVISDECLRYLLQITKQAGDGDTTMISILTREVLGSTLTAEERAVLLPALAVWRSSAQYWSVEPGEVSKAAVHPADLPKILKADLCGAIGGAIAGSLGGPAGAGAGACGGAIGASLYTWWSK
uniref:Uncharacterized protein n=1 Tax=uncultured Latescibacterota bacterium TaxID=199737 RepID=Q2YZV5_9BACT|nr:hypothetical protein [uncultured Latescibacterota bacterium]